MVVYRDQPTYTCDLGYVLSTRVLGGFSTDTENIITCNLNAARNDGEYTPRATSCVSESSAVGFQCAPAQCHASRLCVTSTERLAHETTHAWIDNRHVPLLLARLQTLGCVDGQYTNTDGGCLTCTAECNFGGTEYEIRTCAAMNDRRCASCTIGSYRETLNNGFADACVTCSTTCAPGQRITGDCRRLSLTSDPLFCTSCTPGTFYASQTTANDRTDRCVDCGVGHVCPYSSGDQTATTKTPCNASDEFMAREDGTVCADVLEGYYTVSLDGVHNTDVPHGNQVICERGRRCPTSAGDRGKRFDCAVDQGQFQSGEGATACDTVSRGWYTTPINEALRTGQAQCERGYRCNPDTGVRTKCELNTFTSELGQTECQSLTDSFYVVVKDTSPDRLRIAEVEATEGQYVSTTTVDQDGDRHLIPCGRGYQCPYRGDRDACADNITFSEILSGPACLPCYRCPTSEIITAECIPAQDTVCNDEVPPVFELATDRITLEAVSDPVYDAFGESDPVTAYDDRSTFEDPGARQLLTDRIRRSSNSTFISPPPQSCSYLTERCSFVSPVDMTLVGTHTITYTVRDNSDNSQTASRVVTVVDTTPPVITLNTDATVFIQVQEDPYAALLDSLFIGLATASDTLDDLLGNTLVPAVPDDQRDRLLEAIGVASDGATLWDAARLPAAERLRSDGWRLNYTDVVDSNGNSAAAVTQTFILRDGSPPEIVANNRSYAWNAVRNSNQPFEGFPVDYGATALDFVYGDLSNTVTVQSDGGFTLAALGDYTITYHVADPSGNGATATAVVSVVDTLRPVITLRTRPCLDAWCDVACSSASECDVNYGSIWSDPGVDVADTFAPQNQLNVNVRGALDQTTVGAGSDFVFTPPAATTPATAVPLNTSAPLGTRFVLSYNVVDSAQNAAVTRTRTVTIVDVSPPRFPQLDGNDTIIDITSGNVYDEAASCPFAVDNFDGRIETACVYYNASISTQRVNRTVYRQNFDFRNETRFRETGEFNVTYFVVDANGNTGTANRTFLVSSAIEASAASAGIGGGGIAGIVIVILLMVVLVPAVVVAMQRRKLALRKSAIAGPSNGMTEFMSPVFTEAAAMPPPPELWFHGDIDRTLAEERLRSADDSIDGVYLVRTRNSNSHSASYALSMLVEGRIIHYALSIPEDGRAPLLIQNVPTSHEWGTCLHDIIGTLRHPQQGCTITSGLQTPVPIPSNARDIASMYGPSTTATEVYRKITVSPSLYTISTAFEVVRDGVFYRIFVPPDRVPLTVMVYTTKRGSTKEFEIIDRAAVNAWTPVYVRVAPEQLPGLVGASMPEEAYDSFDPPKLAPSAGGAASGGGQAVSGQPPHSGAMYTAVSRGTAFAIPHVDDSPASGDFSGFADFDESGDGDVVYSAVDHSGGAAGLGGPSNESSDVLYSAVDHRGAAGVGGPSTESSDVLYSAVDHRGGAARGVALANESSDVLYSAVDHGGGAAGSGATPNESSSDVLYSAVDHASTAVGGAILAESGDVVYSAVAHDSAAPARVPVPVATSDMYSSVDKRGGSRNANPAAIPEPTTPGWLHNVNRVEAEAILLDAGGTDGLYLVRPKDPGFAMSIILRGRFVHRLIEPKPGGQFVVDRQGGNWGTTLSDVVLHLENEMQQKHGLTSVRPVLAVATEDDFDGFC